MSIVLVTFPAAPTPSPEALQREADLEASIERRIEGQLILLIFFYVCTDFFVISLIIFIRDHINGSTE